MTSRGEIKVMLNLCSRERNFVVRVGVKPGHKISLAPFLPKQGSCTD